jgi:hypothetical protein
MKIPLKHLIMSDRIARIALSHYNNANNQLKSTEDMKNNTRFVPSELITCGSHMGDLTQ